MTSKINKPSLILILIIVGVFSSFFFLLSSISSQSLSDIQKEIDQNRKALEETVQEINAMQKDLIDNQSNLANLSGGIPRLEAELKDIDLQIEINKKKLELLEEENALKETEMKKLELSQIQSIDSTYRLWRTEYNGRFNFLADRTSFVRAEYYNTHVLGFGNELIGNLASELNTLGASIEDSKKTLEDLNQENDELLAKKTDLEQQILQLNITIAAGQTQLASLKTQQESLENTIGNLLVDQQTAARKEAEILQNTPPPNPPSQPTDPIVGEEGVELPENATKTFRLSGKGRDLYQGHGVGMSQWGAYGGASSGMTYDQIVKFYYKDTILEARPKTISVQGYGQMDLDTYVSGIGEVPNKACGTAAQAQANPSKYVVDNPSTVWDCWPEEAIKAQVVVARSYASHYAGTICTTAACQVYHGGEGKRWAAQETSNIVVVSAGSTHYGQVANTLYSSDNSQGSGTANNDTIFQNFYGDGSPYSYLRAANDASFAAPTSWTNWTYQSGLYSMYTLWQMLNFTANSPSSTADASTKNLVRDFIAGSKNISKVDFERDPSGRVKKMYITFDTGVVKSIGGWWFKNIWNNWAYDVGTYDYIYSQTFYLQLQ